ncbi:putative odorant receptor 92a [Tenebrio molitor]|uniref:putative odorant receptor 92a n=1 Tax=Tenebrio molitor TaxID=7067 RepID=UPI00362496F8
MLLFFCRTRSDVYQILNRNLFGQFFMSTVALCFTSLQLSVVSPTSTQFIALITYEIALLAELLMFCWWGNELIMKSQLIPQAAFESDWVESSVSYKKDLAFFIMRTQKPMTLFAIDFFSISLSTFILAGSDWFQYDGVPDFNFWGYTKDLLYEVEINTEGQLRERIADAANQIRNNPETLNSVYEN